MDFSDKNTYHRCAEVYLLDVNDYTILCCHCGETYDFDDFRNHSSIHEDEHKLIQANDDSDDETKFVESKPNIDYFDDFRDHSSIHEDEHELIQSNEDSDDETKFAESELYRDYKDESFLKCNENKATNMDKDNNCCNVYNDAGNSKDSSNFKKSNEIEEIFCPHCKTFFKYSNHDLEKCDVVQKQILQSKGDLEKLLNDGIYVCSKCPRHFSECQDLYQHHKQESHCSLKINCIICIYFNKFNLVSTVTKNFKEENSDKNAKKNIILDPKKLCCKYCNKTFKMKFNLEKHEKLHNSEKLKCKYCEKSFRTPYKANVHMRLHTDERPYRCKMCTAAFTVSAHLKNHVIYKHTDSRPFSCEFEGCNATFKLPSLKHEHQKRHLPNKIQCEVCGTDYKTKASLLKHQLSKHEDPSKWPHQCETCNKKFAVERYLIDHRRVHTGEKPFGCDVCPKFFRKKSALRGHRQLHNDLKKYICNSCGKIFRQSTTYESHIKTHFNKT